MQNNRNTVLLALSLASLGCGWSRPPSDPLAVHKPTFLARLASDRNEEQSKSPARNDSVATDDPFLQSSRDHNVNQPDRAMGGDPDAAAAEQAAKLIVQSQLSRDTLHESDDQRRLRELELKLQFTDDRAQQDEIALEIARLRRQLRRE